MEQIRCFLNKYLGFMQRQTVMIKYMDSVHNIIQLDTSTIVFLVWGLAYIYINTVNDDIWEKDNVYTFHH